MYMIKFFIIVGWLFLITVLSYFTPSELVRAVRRWSYK